MTVSGNEGGTTAAKLPNERLASWFQRSGWSKGELARQVNRRARQMGAGHVSTDTSRVRRWLDGEQPREPIPRILSELFSERFGCVVTVEDLGLRVARQSAAISGVDLPWAGTQTAALINEFSRSDLMLGRRGFLGTSLTISAGASLIEPMQRWLVPTAGGPDPAVPGDGGGGAGGLGTVPAQAGTRRRLTGLSGPELDMLDETITMFRRWDASSGGGLRRKAVVGQLHEVTDLLHESHPPAVRRRLFRITAELAALAGWMSYDIGLQPTAQKYFVLALHAAKEAEERALGAYILAQMSRQMIHLGRAEDALELIHLAQYGGQDEATPRTLSMLFAMEARAHASLGQGTRCHRAVRMAEETFGDITRDDGDPDWIRFFSLAELHAENAHSYRDLAYVAGRSPAHVSRARPHMEQAVELFGEQCAREEHGPHRSYALNLIGLATVHLLENEPEACAERAGQAIVLAKTLRSERVSNRLRKTTVNAAREYGDVAEVVSLLEHVTQELPENSVRRAV
nr:hypothetical protein [Streptomyces sp. YIM 98790]